MKINYYEQNIQTNKKSKQIKIRVDFQSKQKHTIIPYSTFVFSVIYQHKPINIQAKSVNIHIQMSETYPEKLDPWPQLSQTPAGI